VIIHAVAGILGRHPSEVRAEWMSCLPDLHDEDSALSFDLPTMAEMRRKADRLLASLVQAPPRLHRDSRWTLVFIHCPVLVPANI
jgi:hypothetical protein